MFAAPLTSVQEGFDLQITGYGFSAVYHGINEYCSIEGMKNGFTILNDVIETLDKQC